jgi:hypothetical protein
VFWWGLCILGGGSSVGFGGVSVTGVPGLW